MVAHNQGVLELLIGNGTGFDNFRNGQADLHAAQSAQDVAALIAGGRPLVETGQSRDSVGEKAFLASLELRQSLRLRMLR